MECREIMEVLEQLAPVKYALEWDNVGLLIGDDKRDVQKIMVALDATNEIVDEAVELGVDMIITHHPMIFKAMKKINNSDFIGSKVLKLIENKINYYAMHTNYDIAGGMAQLTTKGLGIIEPRVLSVTNQEEQKGIGIIGNVEEITLFDLSNKIKAAYNLESVIVYGDIHQHVKRVAVSSGAGRSMLREALTQKAQVMITGDIDYHTAIDAIQQDLCIIDAGHFGTEHMMVKEVGTYLQKQLKDEVVVYQGTEKNPFQII